MTVQELEDAVINISENSIKKLKVRSWMAVELGRIINRKHYWWRKKYLSFTSQSGIRLYDLARVEAAAYKDFAYFASSLYRFNTDGSRDEIPFAADNRQILEMVYDTTNGDPKVMTIEPGTTKVIRVSPAPTSSDLYRGMYYAGFIINWTSPEDKEIPLIPEPFHYVALASMERRVFQYLYGQKDPRAILAAQAEQLALADLDNYKAPSTVVQPEWRSSDERAFVQSTN